MSQLLGSNPLSDAMARRGMSLSDLSQVSPSAATFRPDEQVPPFPPSPNLDPMAGIKTQLMQGPDQPLQPPQALPVPTPQQNIGVGTNIPSPVGTSTSPQPLQPMPVPRPAPTPVRPQINPYGNDEAQAIVKVLGDRLSHHTKMEAKSAR